jgi:raffinose/stachyose/melibiose transport system permease protein
MSKARTSPLRSGFVHLALMVYTVIALFPVS